MPTSWKRPDRTDATNLLATSAWWLRAGVFIVVAAVVLTAHGNLAAGIVELTIAAAAMIGWWASGRLPAPWAGRSLFVCLTVITAAGGVAAASHQDTSVLALAIISVLAAGVDLPLGELLVVFLAGVLAVEIAAVSSGHTDLGTVLGYPALLAGVALVGRYRRAYRTQTEPVGDRWVVQARVKR